ncbi:MAG: hypothetical protein LC662_13240 [Rhodothermaceae bacterium]|nr:hypothetical protein [Rhodothermaceae bacterium]
MQKKAAHYFSYPPNIRMLDLATLVHLYRTRGEPRRSPAGEYFACAVSHKLIKESKHWFGLNYSQVEWDKLLTKNSDGYPLTEVEMNILGMARIPREGDTSRSFIEENCGTIPKLAFMVINDLKTFGFVEENEEGFLSTTQRGMKALEGVARRIYEKKFSPEMLHIHLDKPIEYPVATRKEEGKSQTSLF